MRAVRLILVNDSGSEIINEELHEYSLRSGPVMGKDGRVLGHRFEVVGSTVLGLESQVEADHASDDQP